MNLYGFVAFFIEGLPIMNITIYMCFILYLSVSVTSTINAGSDSEIGQAKKCARIGSVFGGAVGVYVSLSSVLPPIIVIPGCGVIGFLGGTFLAVAYYETKRHCLSDHDSENSHFSNEV
jgi:hypothetical protein